MISAAVAFVITAALIVIAGTYLARSADIIAARTNLGSLWVGSVFLALSTSLPELVTDVVAVRIGQPDLAAGDLFGSSMANMLILGLIGILPSGAGLFRKAALDHVLYAALAIMLSGIAAIAILIGPAPRIGPFGAGSIGLLLAYGFGSWAAFRHSTVARAAGEVVEMSSSPTAAAKAPGSATPSLRRALTMFSLAAAVVLVAAPRFAHAAGDIAVLSGLGSTVVGTALVGLATSLPELATSVAAVRMKAFDLAVGNLFGSNALNMSVFAVLDTVHAGGPVLTSIGTAHAISALAGTIMMGIAVASLVYRAQGIRRMREPASVLLVIAYVAGLIVVVSQ